MSGTTYLVQWQTRPAVARTVRCESWEDVFGVLDARIRASSLTRWWYSLVTPDGRCDVTGWTADWLLYMKDAATFETYCRRFGRWSDRSLRFA